MLSVTIFPRLISNSRTLTPTNLYTPANLFHYSLVNFTQENHRRSSPKLENDDTSETLHRQFPEPKTVLHNFYQMVSSELKTPKYEIPKPQFKQIHLGGKGTCNWNCVYKLPWPEEIKIEAVAATKQEAAKRAAVKALNILTSLQKMTKDGCPVIYDYKSESKLLNKPISMDLSSDVVRKLENVVAVYEGMNKSEIQEVIARTNESKVDPFFGEDLLNPQLEKKYYQRNSTSMPSLPISNYKDQIINTIEQNQIVIIRGEPGCGKSTQVPQYIYDHWFEHGKNDYQQIIISQPRRIAATSLAERVANEREENLGETVGYHVRLDSVYNKETGSILYCTSGILLKQIQNDPNLRQFTHVILDEAHERDVNTDLLMVLLRKAVKMNPNLKVIVMSATIDVKLFQEYFKTAPVIDIPGFTYPVKSYYLEDLRFRLPKTTEVAKDTNPTIFPEDICQVINWLHNNKKEGAILCFLPGWDDIIKVKRRLEYERDNTRVIFPLHSKLTLKDQRKIFSPMVPGVRKIILATNIAETSVTIDDVVYVVDTGAHKEQRLDKTKELECVDNYWISQANVAQRRGRAGRVQPGECYHLYTRTKHEEMEKYQLPVILRVSLTKLVLDTKVYDTQTKAIDFFKELPSPPEYKAVKNAVDELIDLKVLNDDEKLTPLGKTIALFSLSPMLSKSLVYSYLFQCVEPVLDIVTVLSLDSDFFASHSAEAKSDVRTKKEEFSKDSDHLAFHRFMEEWRETVRNNQRFLSTWCYRNHINEYKMKLSDKLRDVHLNYIMNFKNRLPISNKYSDNSNFVKSILAAGLNKILYNKTVISRRHQKKNLLVSESGQTATITSESVNFKRKLLPSEFYCYSNDVHSITRRTTIVRETSLISPLSVLLLANMFEKKYFQDTLRFVNVNDSKLQIELDRSHSELITKVQEVINEMVQYFCACHLQSINVEDSEIYLSWCDIVNDLSNVLNTNS